MVNFSKIITSGVAGAVKRDRLKICWLSAYEGSNPLLRINFKKKRKLIENAYKRNTIGSNKISAI